jgi:16S rRNA (guanine1207-N2)-methyltransferase
LTEHYFSNTPSSASNEERFSFELRGTSFLFTSDRGVFSKKEIDFGSRLLIETFQMPESPGPLLDIGCGYGPIGLALAKEDNQRNVHMVDVNERALALAQKNAEVNSVSNVSIY